MISDLERQGAIDRKLVDDLQAQGLLDGAVIAEQAAEQIREQGEVIAQLQAGLVSARRIGAAMGILMATRRVSEQQAFQLLVDKSQNTNRKLREVAIDVVETGSLDGYDRA